MTATPDPDVVHHHVQDRIRQQRARVSPRLLEPYDELVDRHGFLSDDTSLYFNPLIQPIVTFPQWVAESTVVRQVRPVSDDLVLDLVEATLMGYLYVRVQDDLLDEGLGRMPEAMFLADSFLVRHGALLASRSSSPRFWAFHQETSAAYAEAMLLERSLSGSDSDYTEDDFDLVLQRSQPLVLAGALLLDLVDRWDLLDDLRRFVHRVVRAGQIVDDILDHERDVAAGNHTWVARQLGSIDAPARMTEQLILGQIDRFVAIVDVDLDVAEIAARELGMNQALDWIAERRSAVHGLAERILRSALMG